MNPEEAHEILGTKPGTSLGKLESRYGSEMQVWKAKLAASILPKHADQCQQRIRDLDEAIGTLRDSLASVAPASAEAAASAGDVPAGLGEWMRSGANAAAPGSPSCPEGRGSTGGGGMEGFWKYASLGGRISEDYRWLVPSVGITVILLIVVLMFQLSGASSEEDNRPGPTAESPYPKTRLREIADLIKEGKPVEAVKGLNALAKEIPGNPEVQAFRDALLPRLSSLAAGEVKKGNNVTALRYYEAMVELAPDHPLAGVAMAEMNKLGMPQGKIRVSTGDVPATITLGLVVGEEEEPRRVGRKSAPAEFADLAYGRYTMGVVSDGYEPSGIERLDVSSGQLRDLSFDLKRSLGGLRIASANIERAKFVATLVKGPDKMTKTEEVERSGFTPSGELKDLPTGTYSIFFPDFGVRHEILVEKNTVTPFVAALAGDGKVAEGGSRAAQGERETALPTFVALKVRTEESSYRNGDAVVCHIEIPFDGFLRLYSIDLDGNRTRVFPNSLQPDDQVISGYVARIPGSEDWEMPLELAGEKGGVESLHAVLSEHPFEDEDPRSSPTPFVDLGKGGAAELKVRGLNSDGRAGYGETSYKVEP